MDNDMQGAAEDERPQDREVIAGVDLGGTEDVIVFAEIEKDGTIINPIVVDPGRPWIENLLPFPEDS